MVKAQEWLDREYPKEGFFSKSHSRKTKRSETYEIHLTEPIEGELDLGDFTYKYLRVYIFPQVDETKLIFKNKPKRVWFTVIKWDAQTNLNYNYPTQEQRKLITELNIRDKNLTGELDLSDFRNLKKLYCSENKLTSLNVSNCKWLEKIDCSDNLLNSLDVSKNNELTRIDCSRNKLTTITPPTNSTNLEKLYLEYNKFLEQEKINQYSWCWKCQQPNTSERWCQPCAEKEWEKLEGQELIEEFIWQQKRIKWIPYEQFTNIEKIGEGGFSQIYKAKWQGKKSQEYNDKEKKWEKLNHTDVVLKSLTNSQNITLEFLSEVANTKLVDDKYSNIVRCYGISQDPETKNHVIVMEYMGGSNLREHLKNKYSELSLENKLERLKNIAVGLNAIHNQNLLHRDLHSGNILSNYWKSYITDLGLSCLANCQKQEGEIFGVLPYVAPEVLRGQPYTRKADIYSWGIIAYELLTNTYPYSETDNLAVSVCLGHRPNIDKVPIPQELKDLIKRCWDANPKKRPSAGELCNNDVWKVWKNKDYKEIEQGYNTFSQNTPYQIHPTATTTSKMIDTKQITELISSRMTSINLSKTILTNYHSTELDFDIKTPTSTQEITKRFRSLSMEETSQKETKSAKLDKVVGEQMIYSEPIEINYDWTNIHSSFTDELIKKWQSLDFTYQQTQDWINIGLQPTDHNFCAWLRDNKNFTPEQVLNKGNLEQLNQEFLQEQQQSNIEIPPK